MLTYAIGSPNFVICLGVPVTKGTIYDQIDDYLDENSTESSQEFFLEGVDSRSCSVSVIKNEVLLRGVISFDMATGPDQNGKMMSKTC